MNFFHGFEAKKHFKLLECGKHNTLFTLEKYIFSHGEGVLIISGVRLINRYKTKIDVAKRSNIQFLFFFSFIFLPYNSMHASICH